ncbi:MAG: hypothetical protein IV108_03815 [Burkholderiales bacterium]|nr:hypothetical protein [Burkholderiales bacterium]
MRERIAQLAARLMAADGVQDFALAKRKAARQLGADDTQNLPNNIEIEQALRDYHELYQRDEQRVRVREMRQQALAVMRELALFDPHLTGAVLAGTATRFSDISLMLFTDNPKEVELFLLNRNISFKFSDKRYRFGDKLRSVPVLTITSGEHEGVDAAIFSTADLRHAPRHVGDGRPVDKARLSEVEALLEADNNALGSM